MQKQTKTQFPSEQRASQSWMDIQKKKKHSKKISTNPAQKKYRYLSSCEIVIVVREVQLYNYQSHSSIGPYHFWGISPRNSTLFLNGRCTWAVYETITDYISCRKVQSSGWPYICVSFFCCLQNLISFIVRKYQTGWFCHKLVLASSPCTDIARKGFDIQFVKYSHRVATFCLPDRTCHCCTRLHARSDPVPVKAW